MSAMSRRTQIEQLLAEDPHDPFLRYSLALEYEKEGSVDEALKRLCDLMRNDPPYVAAFHMAGQIYAKAGRLEEARRILREGIEAARDQERQHDAAEMADLLATLGNHPLDSH